MSGHDEYWTSGMRDHADRGAGGRALAHQPGREQGATGRCGWSPPTDGRQRRIVTCYKGDARGSGGPGQRAARRSSATRRVSRPENALFGRAVRRRWHQFSFPMVITHPDHWALKGTGLKPATPSGWPTATRWISWCDNGVAVRRGGAGGVPGAVAPGRLRLSGRWCCASRAMRWVFSAGGIDFVHTLAGETGRGSARGAASWPTCSTRRWAGSVPGKLVKFQPASGTRAEGPSPRP